MQQLVFILVVSFGSLFSGYAVQLFLLKSGVMSFDRIKSVSGVLKVFALVVLSPVPIMNSFWKLDLASASLLAFPFLGVLSLLVGGVSAMVFIRIFRIPPERAGSIFTCGMFTNLGIFGSLIGFVLFGDRGYALVQLFTMFEVFIYYVIGFPLSSQIGKGALSSIRFNLSWFRERPAAFVPISSILIGSILNVLNVHRPGILEPTAAFLIPAISGVLTFAIGLTLRVGKIRNYGRELSLIMLIKFAIIPLILIPVGYLLGFGAMLDGVPLKVLVILSFMPVAFIALVPPALYGFDLDLANSGWILTTFSLLLIVPALFFILT